MWRRPLEWNLNGTTDPRDGSVDHLSLNSLKDRHGPIRAPKSVQSHRPMGEATAHDRRAYSWAQTAAECAPARIVLRYGRTAGAALFRARGDPVSAEFYRRRIFHPQQARATEMAGERRDCIHERIRGGGGRRNRADYRGYVAVRA